TDGQDQVQPSNSDSVTPSPGRGPGRGWIWYFVILVVLTVVSLTILIGYNLRQQLKPEQLATARALWEEKGPRDYQMTYTKNGTVTGTFEVEVRKGKVQKVTDDGRPLERWQYAYHSMSALFDDLERFSEMRSQPGGGRRFLVAQFDKED